MNYLIQNSKKEFHSPQTVHTKNNCGLHRSPMTTKESPQKMWNSLGSAILISCQVGNCGPLSPHFMELWTYKSTF